MTQPSVSVVIPTFNRAALTLAAIDACLAQTNAPALEVVVVDDASTDDTAGRVESITDARVRLLRLERNHGAAGARNAGVVAAHGHYVAFLDSDDHWLPDKLGRQFEALRRCADPDNTLCYTQIRVQRSHRVDIEPQAAPTAHQALGDYLFVHWGHIHTSTMVVARELALRHPFDEQLGKHEDYDFCLRLGAAGVQPLLVAQPLVTWQHDSRTDRLSQRLGVAHSLRFLQAQTPNLSPAAQRAFWTRVVFPPRLKSHPLAAAGRLLRDMVSGPLPLRWYRDWLRQSLRNRRADRGSLSSPPA